MSTELLTISAAARLCGVSRQAVWRWTKAGRVATDDHGHILAADFIRERAPHRLVSQLERSIEALPPHQLPAILIETLGANYLVALGNLAREASTNIETEGKVRGDVKK
jgi:hypothetical protein